MLRETLEGPLISASPPKELRLWPFRSDRRDSCGGQVGRRENRTGRCNKEQRKVTRGRKVVTAEVVLPEHTFMQQAGEAAVEQDRAGQSARPQALDQLAVVIVSAT